MGQSFTRQELFDLVWSEPRTALAKQLGVSDVWIGKQCRAARIPVPPAGHWAKAQSGKSTTKAPLPVRLPGQPVVVVVGESASSVRWRRADDIAEEIRPLIIEENIDAQVEAASHMIGRLTATRDLLTPHGGLSRILKREANRRTKFAAHNWSFYKPLFDDSIHQRQLRLFNSLCVAFDRISAKAEVHDNQRWVQGVGDTHQLHLRIDFGAYSLELRFLEPTAGAAALGEQPPAKTTLRVGHGQEAFPDEQWSDGDEGRLEVQLATIVHALLNRAERALRYEAQRHYEWRLERRQELLEQLEEEKRRFEAQRLAAIAAQRTQLRERIKLLSEDARTARNIRDLIEHLEVHPELQINQPDTYVAWRAEAIALADDLDPVKRPLGKSRLAWRRRQAQSLLGVSNE